MHRADACHASAALGVIQRKGVGKIRHLHTGALWLQEQQVRNVIGFQKIQGAANPADLFTKHLSREAMDKFTELIGGVKVDGRSGKAAQLHQLQRKLRQLKSQIKNKTLKLCHIEKPVTEVDVDEEKFFDYVKQVEKEHEEMLSGKCRDWMRHECRAEQMSKMRVEKEVGARAQQCIGHPRPV